MTDNGYVDNWISRGEETHDWEVLEVDYDGHNATDLAIRLCEERNNEDISEEISQTCKGLLFWRNPPFCFGAWPTPLRSRTTMETSNSLRNTKTTPSGLTPWPQL